MWKDNMKETAKMLIECGYPASELTTGRFVRAFQSDMGISDEDTYETLKSVCGKTEAPPMLEAYVPKDESIPDEMKPAVALAE